MRIAFGFVGLMVTIAIFVLVWSMYTSQVANTARPARSAAEQIAGVESSGLGGRASDWIKLDEYAPAGKLQGVTVTQVTAGSSMQAYFGLQAGDRIVNVGPQSVKDIGDAELAKALIAEAYQRKWALVVQRGDQRLELPATAKWNTATPPAAQAAKPAAPAAAPTASPATPAAEPKAPPMQRQLDMIRGMGDRTEQ